MIKAWDDDAWDDYLHWQTQDRKTLRRINALLKDIDRNGYDGIGKPEPNGQSRAGHKRPNQLSYVQVDCIAQTL